MPWTPSSFASRHNRKLTGEAAGAAARQANALIGKGMDEGEAIAIANKTGNRKQGRADHRYRPREKGRAHG